MHGATATAAAVACKRTAAPVCTHAQASAQAAASAQQLEGSQCLSGLEEEMQKHHCSASTSEKAREAWDTGGVTGNGLAAHWAHACSP
jgi:hypothetical protein